MNLEERNAILLAGATTSSASCLASSSSGWAQYGALLFGLNMRPIDYLGKLSERNKSHTISNQLMSLTNKQTKTKRKITVCSFCLLCVILYILEKKHCYHRKQHFWYHLNLPNLFFFVNKTYLILIYLLLLIIFYGNEQVVICIHVVKRGD